jgi:hypothetical protein
MKQLTEFFIKWSKNFNAVNRIDFLIKFSVI